MISLMSDQELDTFTQAIDLPAPCRSQVLAFRRDPLFARLCPQALPILTDLLQPPLWDQALARLKALLGEDPAGMKMLTFMLAACGETRKIYESLQISETIFLDTMKCFPRFINEHLESYGTYGFDRDFWTMRQIAARLFRLGSLEPGIITEEFARELSRIPEICPHFHLSLQSGCDATLKRMNRRYTSAEYAEKCRILRKYFDDPALTTDVIVGFPGETEEEFGASYDFVDSIDFYETHIFKYSRRNGTKAAVMPDQVSEQVKAERSAAMIGLGERKRAAYEKQYVGREVEVLVEEDAVMDGRCVQVGHTKEYIKVALESNEDLKNRIVKVRIENDSQIMH